MCGIVACYGRPFPVDEFLKFTEKIIHRGPDKLCYKSFPDVQLGFTRLAINGLSNGGDQPFDDDCNSVICNGEIFNHTFLANSIGYSPYSSSDCEVISPLLKVYPFTRVCDILDAEFSMVVYDKVNNQLMVARDRYGVRPLFIGWRTDLSSVLFASEAKALTRHPDIDNISQVQPGIAYIYSKNKGGQIRQIFEKNYNNDISIPKTISHTMEGMLHNIRTYLISAVEKRMMSDRGVCCLLSGGLDSSLVCAIASRYLHKRGKRLSTFAIGMKGSTDLEYAEQVADYIDSDHTSIVVSEDDFIDAIPDVIRSIESYDTTTVRASVGNYLVGEYIKEHTDFKVVLNGDYSDEVCGGYLYIKGAPGYDAFHEECKRLVGDIHYFDSLRSDRTICAHGLEARAPFADKDFVAYYMGIDVEITSPMNSCEKYLLREAFSSMSLLPDNILWRRKEAFSDGVSSEKRSWHTILKERYKNEDKYYRDIFEKEYGKITLVPYKWMPRWCDATDPSARELKVYSSI